MAAAANDAEAQRQRREYDKQRTRENRYDRIKRWVFYGLIVILAILTIKDVTGLVMEYVGNPKKAGAFFNLILF
jgi:hypothetical protein